MSLEMFFAFVVTTIVLISVPGPTVVTLVGYSVSHGSKATVPLVSAVILGDSTAIFLSLIGLGTLMSQSSALFQTVKLAGGIYLIYLGIRQLLSGFAKSGTHVNSRSTSMRKLFANTFAVTALNPKGIIFYVSFLPQFVTPGGNTHMQLLILALTFIILAAVNATLFCLFAGKAKSILSSSAGNRFFNIFGGALLTTAGAWALTAKRNV